MASAIVAAAIRRHGGRHAVSGGRHNTATPSGTSSPIACSFSISANPATNAAPAYRRGSRVSTARPIRYAKTRQQRASATSGRSWIAIGCNPGAASHRSDPASPHVQCPSRRAISRNDSAAPSEVEQRGEASEDRACAVEVEQARIGVGLPIRARDVAAQQRVRTEDERRRLGERQAGMVDELRRVARDEVQRRARVARVRVRVRPPGRAKRLGGDDQRGDGERDRKREHRRATLQQPRERAGQTPRRVSGATLNFQNAKSVIWRSSTPCRQRLMFVLPYVRG